MWVPPAVAKEMVDERRSHEADVLASIDYHKAILDHWNPILKRIDPYLELVKAAEKTTVIGLRAGYWHTLRRYPGAPATLRVIEGPHGEFREPDSGLLRELMEGDHWDDRVRADARKRKAKLRAAEQAEKDLEREERREELAGRMKARFHPGVRIPRSL